MSVLWVENLSFSYGDKVVLRNVSFRLEKGEHAALVGPNGAGKSTLLQILTGNLVPDSGAFGISSSARMGYLDQHTRLKEGMSIQAYLQTAFDRLYKIEEDLTQLGGLLAQASPGETEKRLKEYSRLQDILYSHDFYSIDRKVETVANGLGIAAYGMDTPVGKLSGGQRTKIKLARLLLEGPSLLMLDEPTNYLDQEQVDWLSSTLQDYPGSFVVISHDTGFLQAVSNVTYHLQYAQLKRYPGNYERFLKLRDEESKNYLVQYNRQQKEVARLEEFINKNIVRKSTTKRAQSRRKQLEKIERLEKPGSIVKPSFQFAAARESDPIVFSSSNLSIGYRYPLLSHLDLKLMRGDKIAVVGCNGIGKSTLLKTLLGVIPPISGTIQFGEYLSPVYYEQETAIDDLNVIDDVWRAYPWKTVKEIREALARCGVRQEHVYQKLKDLSGGEQSKVRLCKIMLKPGNLLLLDEPTNHLDVNTKLALKEALLHYQGSILLVCHEKEFYHRLATKVWNLEENVASSIR
jgi:ATPase subunit of ABC transporter with duplicated ATPase domains